MIDQAKALREKVKKKQTLELGGQKRSTRVIAVTSGKGGVGKSNFSLNFALSLIQQGKKALIFDMDVGLANIDVLMGLSPEESIISMIEKDLAIEDVIETGANGLQFLSGGSGLASIMKLNDDQLTKILDELGSLQGKVDYIILDTGAGISQENLRFLLASDEVILVINPEPTSITDAYAVVKMLYSKNESIQVKLVVNRCVTEKEGQQTSANFKRAVEQFLRKEIEVLGWIPDDKQVPMAVKQQKPYLLEYPKSDAAVSMNNLVRTYLDLPVSYKLGVKGFLAKMLFNR
ncbi:MinD/ParA family protein [Pseudalkalibacillus caeni]|uniref:MinD/ParA family protein n=1 Tax=Exobacillus caeni TaxID=2574798 RepID=A0A5R9F292_9BACL|nr:MinD/ParA family protein [Pseudalkalibacillus caeni]TLS36649.1 MinD/ParA family protein [Pseudalkalibacillus caeni]